MSTCVARTPDGSSDVAAGKERGSVELTYRGRCRQSNTSNHSRCNFWSAFCNSSNNLSEERARDALVRPALNGGGAPASRGARTK